MKFRGGYNLFLTGKPSGAVQELPVPNVLSLPLFSPRFSFTQIAVEDGDEVTQGQILAKDPANHDIPLLAPRAGTVKNVDEERRLIILENLQTASSEAVAGDDTLPAAAQERGEDGTKLHTLVRLGAWSFVSDAFTGHLPDPYAVPQAVIVSTTRLEPFISGAEVLLMEQIEQFEAGLRQLCSLAAGKPVYLIMPKNAVVASRVRGIASKDIQATLIEVPQKYPYDNVKLCAQKLGCDSSPQKGAVWACSVEGVLAVDQALNRSKPCIDRVLSVAGPGAKNPGYIRTIPGYPVQTIRESYQDGSPTRLISGGALTGITIEENQQGLDIECIALTLIPEHNTRELLAFANPGITKHAFSKTFLGALRPKFFERYTTGIRGEHRPCVTCCCCESACPAGIMPHQTYKYVDKNRLAEAERIGLLLCVQCGLCSHVCPSKIEIKQGLLKAQETLYKKRQAEEVHS